MHQMRISTNEVSSVVLEPKKLEVEKKKTREKCKEQKKKKIILCHEIEPNPSKERAMHEGDVALSKFDLFRFFTHYYEYP